MTDRPLKIIQVNAADTGGGAERSVMTLHLELRTLGHQSTLFVGEKITDVPGVQAIPYVRGLPGIRRLARWVESKTGWLDIYNPSFRNLMNLIPKDTDVLHFHNLWGSSGFADLGALPAMTRCWPGVLTERQNWTMTGHCACFHDCTRWKGGCGRCPNLDLPPAISRDGTAFNWRRKRRLIQASRLAFVGISDYVCQLARQSPIWKGMPITRIYNGIDLQTFRPVLVERKRGLRQKLGLPENGLIVLLSGQTLEGFREGIATEGFDALNRLADPRVVPLLVGKSAVEASRRLNVPCVTVGFRDQAWEMAECYQAADMTLVTSKVEGFGRIAAESQACGTPVVAFNSGGLSEFVLNEVGGLSVRQGDVAGLVAALKRMLDDDDLRMRCGTQGRVFAENTFEAGLIARQYVNLYRAQLADRD